MSACTCKGVQKSMHGSATHLMNAEPVGLACRLCVIT